MKLVISCASQDFKPIFSIICSYTVHAMAAIRVRLRARGTPPRKNPTKPKSCEREQTNSNPSPPASGGLISPHLLDGAAQDGFQLRARLKKHLMLRKNL